MRPLSTASFACAVSLTAACGGSTQPAEAQLLDGGIIDAPAGSVVEHGVIVDYFTLKPVAGITVTDNGATSTTDANGRWSLTVPARAVLRPLVASSGYTQIQFPDATAAPGVTDIDYGRSVIADASAFSLERDSLDSFDTSRGLLHVVVRATGSCASVAGATVAVMAPDGTRVTYFGSAGIPDATATEAIEPRPDRPIAVLYDIAPGADISVKVNHPTCKQAQFPTTNEGRVYSGKVAVRATEPNDATSALVIILE